MSKITKSARGETCTINIPGICNYDPETTTLCHAPHPDKGMGIKGPDSWAAYGCSSCHDEMDSRTWRYFRGEPRGGNEQYQAPSTTERAVMWFRAIRETQRRLIAKGLMPK